MTRVVISGYYGFANAGDEAMLAAIVGSLKDIIPDVAITVITGNCRMTRENHKVQAVHRLNFFAIAAAIRRCDILISGGGSLLQDVTSARSLYYYLWIMKIALFFKKPVMLYAQGIGPVRGIKAREAVQKVLQRVSVIGVRDRDSKAELMDMGVTRPPIHVTADAVLSMHPVDKAIGLQILEQKGITGSRRRVGIAVRNWQGHQAYKDAIAQAADTLQQREDVDIIFIPMQHPEDVAAGRDIADRMKTRAIVLDDRYSTVEFMSLMGCMDAVVANRLHASSFGLMETPATAISYDPKIDSFIHLIGDRVCGTTESVTAEALASRVSQQLAQGGLEPAIKARLNHLRRQSLRNAYLALRILEGRDGVRKRLEQHRRSL